MRDAEFEMGLLGFQNNMDSNPCDVLTLRIQYDGLQLGYAARPDMVPAHVLHVVYSIVQFFPSGI